MLRISTLALCLGFLLDILLGDPQGWPHIVRAFGWLIAGLEKVLYPLKNKRLGGTLLVLCTLFVCAGLPAALLAWTWRLSPWTYLALEALLCWQLLAAKSLQTESRKVYDALAKGDLPDARRAVSMIVGRDTATLDEAGVARAAVETIAENAADGVSAPLFYIALGGAALGCFYKAVNTMDSMIGYKNERYLDFGRCAARLDDAMNYIPARLCALLMIFAARLCGLDSKSARRVWKRDRRRHASPNSAQTEAVMAGALNLHLGGDAYYFGQLHKKPYIGDDGRPIKPEDILRAHRLLYGTAALLLLVALIFRGCLYAAL
ncbi:MAG: adenosylcobinamide-phosphate synthase CbiB [Candidatus Pelethousia sp.]|nr:adenosylcobinamide-phosphate synthase CbiB [Candidatus Pelethousia sp.]